MQLCHLNVYEIGVLPFQVPVVAVSFSPTTASPEIWGGVSSTGAFGFFGTWPVAFARAVVCPSAFLAVTSRRIV